MSRRNEQTENQSMLTVLIKVLALAIAIDANCRIEANHLTAPIFHIITTRRFALHRSTKNSPQIIPLLLCHTLPVFISTTSTNQVSQTGLDPKPVRKAGIHYHIAIVDSQGVAFLRHSRSGDQWQSAQERHIFGTKCGGPEVSDQDDVFRDETGEGEVGWWYQGFERRPVGGLGGFFSGAAALGSGRRRCRGFGLGMLLGRHPGQCKFVDEERKSRRIENKCNWK